MLFLHRIGANIFQSVAHRKYEREHRPLHSLCCRVSAPGLQPILERSACLKWAIGTDLEN
jgi:hypothetical protein